MADGIEVHFDEEEGHVCLDCDEERYRRLRDQLLDEVTGDGDLITYSDGIRSILVRRAVAIDGESGWRRRRMIAVAATVALLALSVLLQIVGLVALTRWLLGGTS